MIQSQMPAALADEQIAELRRQADHERLARRARNRAQPRARTRAPKLLAGILLGGILLAAIGLLAS